MIETTTRTKKGTMKPYTEHAFAVMIVWHESRSYSPNFRTWQAALWGTYPTKQHAQRAQESASVHCRLDSENILFPVVLLDQHPERDNVRHIKRAAIEAVKSCAVLAY